MPNGAANIGTNVTVSGQVWARAASLTVPAHSRRRREVGDGGVTKFTGTVRGRSTIARRAGRADRLRQ